MSSDPEQEFFADGLTEDIITALSRIREMFVISRNSSFVFKVKLIVSSLLLVNWESGTSSKGAFVVQGGEFVVLHS